MGTEAGARQLTRSRQFIAFRQIAIYAARMMRARDTNNAFIHKSHNFPFTTSFPIHILYIPRARARDDISPFSLCAPSAVDK